MEFTILENHVDFVRNGANIKQLKTCNTGIPITRIETLSNGVFNFDKLGYANILDDKYQNFYLEDNDVLLSHINSAKFVGRSVIYKKSQLDKIIHGMNLLCIRFIKDKYLPDFFVWYTKSKQAKLYFVENTKHAINQASITSTAIKQMPIPNVDISTQVSITNDLNNINAAISLAKERLLALDELVKSRFIEMFGDIESQSYKSIDSFGKVFTGSTPSMKIPEYYQNNDIPFIKPSDFSDNVSFLRNSDNFIDNKAEKAARIFLEGAVLVTCIGIVGKIGIATEKGSCNQQINYIVPNENTNPIFLAYSILSQREIMVNIAKDAPIVPIINKSKFSQIKIPYAHLNLQNEFAEFVKLIDKSKFIVQQQIKDLEELLDSKMDEYFR